MSTTPSSDTSSSPSLSTTSKATKPKPVNVFSNDGSFLDRFQRSKQDELDRHKAEETLQTKRQFADRFKNRGKRAPLPDASPAVTYTDVPAKKARLEPNPVGRFKE